MSLKTVKLATGLECLADPCFIVEMEGAYYLAVAVLEYNGVQAGPNLMKTEGVAHVRNLFEQGHQQMPARACPINSNGTLPYLPGKQHSMRTAARAAESTFAATAETGVSRGWMSNLAAGVLGIFGRRGAPRPPMPPPINPPPGPPPPPAPSDDPLGMQTEPPGMQTSP